MLHSAGVPPHWGCTYIPSDQAAPFPCPSYIKKPPAAAKGQRAFRGDLFQWTISLSLCGCMGVKERTMSADSRKPLSQTKTGWSVKVKEHFWSPPWHLLFAEKLRWLGHKLPLS